MNTSKLIDKKSIVPISKRKMISSNESLKKEIRGVIELKGGYYLAGSKDAKIAIFSQKDLQLKGKLHLENIDEINHLSKIKDEKLDLIAISSNLSDIIIISVFQKEKKENEKTINNKEIKKVDESDESDENDESEENEKPEEKDEPTDNIFDYKIECRIQGHSDKINRIIQLSNNNIVSASKDCYVIFWEIIKTNGLISLNMIKKLKFVKNIYYLIECPYTNELICNNQIIDLKSLTLKRKLNIYLPSDTFNCGMCLFKDKYIASFCDDCENIDILNIENNDTYRVEGRFDYVEAVYTVDNETFCLCTQNLNGNLFFSARYSQHFKLNEKKNKFKEIGEMMWTGTCNCYMNDSEGNFVMGDMFGRIVKFLIE